VARLNAEGQAADSERRLQVAQEQVAEFAHQREEEATNLMRQMGVALAGLHPDTDPATLAHFQVSLQHWYLGRVPIPPPFHHH